MQAQMNVIYFRNSIPALVQQLSLISIPIKSYFQKIMHTGKITTGILKTNHTDFQYIPELAS
jgi:hypothetical protein